MNELPLYYFAFDSIFIRYILSKGTLLNRYSVRLSRRCAIIILTDPGFIASALPHYKLLSSIQRDEVAVMLRVALTSITRQRFEYSSGCHSG